VVDRDDDGDGGGGVWRVSGRRGHGGWGGLDDLWCCRMRPAGGTKGQWLSCF
jgi:hypothetical protein